LDQKWTDLEEEMLKNTNRSEFYKNTNISHLLDLRLCNPSHYSEQNIPLF
jgi:hypothetical protein